MKKTLSIIGLLFLVGCQPITSEQVTKYEVNKEEFVRIKVELRDCMKNAVNTSYYGLERLRFEIQECDDKEFHRLRFRDNPETFYVYWDGVNGFDPFDGFTFCSGSLASPMWDFPPEATTYSFRDTINDCIKSFPSNLSVL